VDNLVKKPWRAESMVSVMRRMSAERNVNNKVLRA